MPNQRLKGIPGFSIDRIAKAAGDDPEVLRMENLDTDLPPPASAISATRSALSRDENNSYLPFTGLLELRKAVTERLFEQSGHRYDHETEVLITCGGTEGMTDTLLAVTDPGDEVILTDPTYAGMTNRVRLVGAVPRLAPLVIKEGRWRLDYQALRSMISHRTRALFLMNPSMPSGALLTNEEWGEIADICRRNSLLLVYNAAMERILFDGLPFIHPAGIPGMVERTITIGSVSKEYRMIGWRIGWVVGPSAIMEDVALVHIYNVVTPTGIAQTGACAALRSPRDELARCVAEWQRRRDAVLDQLGSFSVVVPDGGWSLLLDVGIMGYDSFTASQILLEKGKVAVTPMREWGERNSDQFVRLVFSNEPVERLRKLRDRFTRSLGFPTSTHK